MASEASETLTRGRASFDRNAWADAYQQLTTADQEAPLAPEDLDRLAVAAYLTGRGSESVAALSRAHHAHLAHGDAVRAARSAFWLAFTILDDPTQRAQAGGWLGRARRVLDEHGVGDCSERGFLMCAAAFHMVVEGNLSGAHDTFEQAARMGRQLGDRDLTALARHGAARSLLRTNRAADGLAAIDEVMISVTCGEVGPIVAGIIYCSVISACHDIFDLRRAQEWTTALTRWCEASPQMAAFHGSCLVRRSELLQLHGAWPAAMDDARRACERLAAKPHQPDTGAAFYQSGELHRLRGEFDKAEEAYRRASQEGRKPDPGYALLRLAQGNVDAATASIRRVLEECRAPRARSIALRAAVEILLAANDIPAARDAAEELTRIADDSRALFLQAAAAHAGGAVAVAAGDPKIALAALRDAWAIWQELDAPYEIAHARALLGLAYRTLGDEDGAQLEFDAAKEHFEQLGAVPGSAQIASMLATPTTTVCGPLTGREVEVLRLVAAGKTNRVIASELAISEKTVARHLSNIFTKLDLPSRSAATAYAYEHKLV